MANAANIVKFKRSAVAGKAPATTDLQLGELALNTYDGKIYFLNSQDSGATLNLTALQEYSAGNSITINASGLIDTTQDLRTTASPTFYGLKVTNITDYTNSTGSVGQVLTSTANGVEWSSANSSVSGNIDGGNSGPLYQFSTILMDGGGA
jgi:hypothetical protein